MMEKKPEQNGKTEQNTIFLGYLNNNSTSQINYIQHQLMAELLSSLAF